MGWGLDPRTGQWSTNPSTPLNSGALVNYQPNNSLDWSKISQMYGQDGRTNFTLDPERGYDPMKTYIDQDSGYAFQPTYNESNGVQTFNGGTVYNVRNPERGLGGGGYATPGYLYDAQGNPTHQPFTVQKDPDTFMDRWGAAIPLLAPFAFSALAGSAAAAGGAGMTTAEAAGVGSSVIPEGSAFTAATAGDMAGMGLGTAGTSGLGSMGLSDLLTKFGGKMATSVLPRLFGGNSAAGGGGGSFGLGDIFNVGAGIYGSQKQGEAAQKYMDWMNGQQNYVRNYGTEGTPEFNYLKQTLEAKDAAAGRNSQYGTRAVDLLGQLGQAKLDATSRMALGFANPYQKALNQDANKYAGLPAAITKLLGGSGGSMNLSSILNGLSTSSGMSNSSFIDALNNSGSMPTGVDYNPSEMPTEQDILPFLDSFSPEDWWS